MDEAKDESETRTLIIKTNPEVREKMASELTIIIFSIIQSTINFYFLHNFSRFVKFASENKKAVN